MLLSEYLRIVRERGWIVVFAAVLGAAIALLSSMAQQPVYQSTVRISVIGARPEEGLSMTVKQLLRNYSSQIRSYDTAAQALASMSEPLDLTADDILDRVRVQAVESDLLLVLEAEDADPHVANLIAGQMAETFIERIGDFNETLDLRDRLSVFTLGPASPASRIRPQKKLDTVAGGILGAVAGLVMVILLEWADTRLVRAPEDIRRDLGLPVLGLVQTQPGRRGLLALPAMALMPPWLVLLLGGTFLGFLVGTIVFLSLISSVILTALT